MVPEQVFAAVRIKLPAPVFVKLPLLILSDIIEETVRLLANTLMAVLGEEPNYMGCEIVNVAFVRNWPPSTLMILLVLPKLPSAAKRICPPFIVTGPVKLLMVLVI